MKTSAFVLFCCLSVSLWAQELPPSSSTPEPKTSEISSPLPQDNWTKLDNLLLTLESTATTLEGNYLKLKTDYVSALINLQEAWRALEKSATAQEELSTLLAKSEASLKSSAALLDQARSDGSAITRSRNLWRVGAILGGVGTLSALFWGLLR